MSSRKCFICLSSQISNVKIVKSQRCEENELKKSLLEHQLDAIFILKHILELNSELLADYLRRCGNPGEWLYLCGECNDRIHQIRNVFRRFQEIKREFEKQKWDLQRKIRSSKDKVEEVTSSASAVRRGRKRNISGKKSGFGNDEVCVLREVFCRRSKNLKWEEVLVTSAATVVPLDGRRRNVSNFGNNEACGVRKMLGGRRLTKVSKASTSDLKSTKESGKLKPLDDSVGVVTNPVKSEPEPVFSPQSFLPEDDFDEPTSPLWNCETEVAVPVIENDLVSRDTFNQEDPVSTSHVKASIDGEEQEVNDGSMSDDKKRNCLSPPNSGVKSKTATRIHKSKMRTSSPAKVKRKIQRKYEDFGFAANNECDICGKKFVNTSSLRGHQARIHKVGDFKCECGEVFAYRPYLIKHKQLGSCEFKLDPAVAESELEVIPTANGYGPRHVFACELCGVTVFGVQKFARHRARVHLIGDYKCDVEGCDKVFESDLGLVDHKLLNHNASQDELESDPLAKPVVERKRREFELSNKKKCEDCSTEEFDNWWVQRIHYLSQHHLIKKCREAMCDICGVKLSRYSLVLKHKASKHGMGDFPCQFCSRAFISQADLNGHRKFPCETKDPSASAPKRKKYTYNYVFECEICQQKFKAKQSLKVHMKWIHEKQSLVPCELCGKSFRDIFTKDRHKFQKHNVADWKCQVEGCGMVFMRERHLKYHVKQSHEMMEVKQS